MRLGYICLVTQHHRSYNQLTSVNTPPPARLAWRQTRSFRPAGLEENFRDRMSQTHCSFFWGFNSKYPIDIVLHLWPSSSQGANY